MMAYLPLIVFVVSLALLVFILFKTKLSYRWLKYAAINLVVAAVLLYLINFSGLFADFYLPINWTTIAAVAVLGVPGLMLLVGLKLTLF